MNIDQRATTVSVALGLAAASFALLSLVPGRVGAEQPARPNVARPTIPVVLNLGDSFVNAGFKQALKPKILKLGARYIVKAKHSTYITTLPRALKVRSLMWNYRPSLVILNIGANEMRMPHPSDHAGAVRRLSQLVSLHGASCVWVTPPPPKSGETGIVQVIKDNSGPCRVYDSSPIAAKIPRGFDHIHPTREGGEIWVDSFWKWLEAERRSPRDPWTLKPRPTKPANDTKTSPAATAHRAANHKTE